MKGWAIAIIAIIIVAFGAGFYAYHRTPGSKEMPVISVPITTPDSKTSSPEATDFVRNLSFNANDLIKSPLVITGEAVGTWYFEGSFPIKVRDQYGVVVATVPAQAQGEWMTTSFVPFKATINFTAPTTTKGFITLEKDNPSGDPEKDQAIIVPVRFK